MPRGIATLDSLRDSNDDDDQSREMYTGGQASGQVVRGPPKNTKDVKDLFSHAQNNLGAISESEYNSRSSDNSNAFSGAGYSLGSTNTQRGTTSEPVSSTVSNNTGNVMTHTITFWKGGMFTVDNGPLRDPQSPENQEFLKMIQEGRLPPELIQMGGVMKQPEIELHMVDKTSEEYVPPPMTPFSGAGQKLGVSKSSSSSNTGALIKKSPVIVNESEPVTTIQVRLANGGRIRIKLNHSHTVADLMSSILNQNPSIPSFELATTFPTTVLSNLAQTVKDANLLNGMVVQRKI